MQKVVSLQTAKRLVESGIVLETEKSWVHNLVKDTWKVQFVSLCIRQRPESWTIIPAPDIAELLEALPKEIDDCILQIGTSKEHGFKVGYTSKKWFTNKILLEALAQLLIWVKTQEGK